MSMIGKGGRGRPGGRRRRESTCCIVAAIFMVPGLAQYSDLILPPLRLFRDSYLLPYSLGRIFVRAYYQFSYLVLSHDRKLWRD